MGRVGDVFGSSAPAAVKPADHSSEPLAAAALLLLVAAGFSVLRLGRLMSRGLLWGRPG